MIFKFIIIFRLLIAAIHSNFNADKDRLEDFTIIHPKHKRGEATIRKVTAPSEYGMIILMSV